MGWLVNALPKRLFIGRLRLWFMGCIHVVRLCGVGKDSLFWGWTNLVGKIEGKPENWGKARKKDLTVKSPEGDKDQIYYLEPKVGFGSKWLGWMWSCISTAKFSVLVNGVSVGFFPSSKGLRQGDPLSPYLFVMGMEVLSNLIKRAVERGFLSGCRIRGGGRQPVHVSHLLFADDTIVFCEARKKYLTYLSWILFWFEAASGLRINLDKSEIIPVGEVEEMEEMVAELGCKVGSMPSVYLGLPMGAPNKSTVVWDGVEEKMRRRLAHWKCQYISKGGRLILIKSTMASMPLYQMSLFRMPKSVARRLEKIAKGFSLGRRNLERKVHLVNWEVVCTEKEKGGLGLRKLIPLNKSLLGKWIWRIRFWNDLWCGCKVLSQRFPHLYGMAAHRNGTVEEMWDQNVGQGDWDLRKGCCFWKGGRNGQFKVKEAYNLVVNTVANNFPKNNIWVDKVPTKILFFAWEATWGKVLMLDRLQKRGWHLPNRCFLCGCEEETVNHILIHCIVAKVLWI
ncbi:putative ribonuclease H protein [Vitis vinifera]|uniref:Putative ribonuclease H protein n=1 Tax=Vitis vinifera TaxID=29760 RepID=A0A438ILT2_VITVI|nr:putative ribonuclease H protein [Vitis vinifera]